MSLKIASADEMREIDRITIQERGVAGIDLMERAGEAVVREIEAAYRPRRVAIVAGKGNNAGDGLVVARLLADRGVEVILLPLVAPDSFSEAGRINFERLPEGVQVLDRLQTAEMPRLFSGCDVLVDAILGTGITGPVRGTFGEAIAIINGLGIPVLSIDVPSGLNSDTGKPEGACILAERTVTLGLPKIGMMQHEGPMLCGKVTVADIGFPEDLLQNTEIRIELLEKADVRQSLPDRPLSANKGTFGSLLVIAGSAMYGGAAYLTCAAGLRSGCGLVYAALPASVVSALAPRLVEAIKIPMPEKGGSHLSHDAWKTLEPALGKASALALGPGIGTHTETARLVDELVCLDLPMVIDADALNCLGEKVNYLTKRESATILTPHPGEMARLNRRPVDEIQADRLGAARELAANANAVVLLKGAQTVIAEPRGRVWINPTGNHGMAKGGTGDLLTGLIGGLLAQGCSAVNAACAGAYLHGLAGDLTCDALGARAMTAGDILDHFALAFRQCEA